MSDILMPKGQALIFDRLRRRVDDYRKHHNESVPRFQHTTSRLNEQQKQETRILNKRNLESKSKKTAKKSDKKQDVANGSHKAQKRSYEDNDIGSSAGGDSLEPQSKTGKNNGNTGDFKMQGLLTSATKRQANTSINNESLKKYSLDSIHTSISNVSSVCSTLPLNIDSKQEGNCGFVDLDQCALALEKDGSMMSGLMGDDTPDGMINSDTLKDLISEISDLNPDFMKEFDLDDDYHKGNGVNDLNVIPMHSHGGVTHGEDNASRLSPFTHCRTPSLAPVTPTATTSPRLQTTIVKTECESAAMSSIELCSNGNTGRPLSHCSGHSPAAAATASPLATQLNAQHPSQTPPYCSASSTLYDTSNVASPSSSLQGVPTSNLSSQHNPTNYCPPANSHQTGSNHGSNVQMGSKNAKHAIHIPYTSPGSLVMDSPAAQTLKQMAEQHQHKAQLNMNNYNKSGSSPSPARSPFNASASASSDSYSNFSNNEFGPPQPIQPTLNSANKFNNVPLRTQSGLSHMDSMEMNIKHEHNTMYANPNCPPPYIVMDNPHVQQQQQQQQRQQQQQQQQSCLSHNQVMNNMKTLNQQHPSQPQLPVNNKNSPVHVLSANRMGNPSMMSMLPSNKSFNSVRSPNLGMPAASNRNLNVPNSGYIPRLPNTPLTAPAYQSVRQPNGLHSNYSSPGPPPPHNDSQTHMSQSVISDTNNSTQQGVMGMRMDFKPSDVPAVQHNLYYQQQPQQQQPHPRVQPILSSATEFHPYNDVDSATRGGQTINFTQQHLRMGTPMINRPMEPGLAARLNPATGLPTSNDPRPHPDMVQQQQRMQLQRAQSVPQQQNQSILSSNQIIPNHFSGPGRPLGMQQQPTLLRPPSNNMYNQHQPFINNNNVRVNFAPNHRGPSSMVANQTPQNSMGHQHLQSMGQPNTSMPSVQSTSSEWMAMQNQESADDSFHNLSSSFNSQGMGMQQQMNANPFGVPPGYSHQSQQHYPQQPPQSMSMCNSYQPQGGKPSLGSMDNIGNGSMMFNNGPHQQQLLMGSGNISKVDVAHHRQQEFNFDLLDNIATDNEAGATSRYNDDFFTTFDSNSGNSSSNFSNILDSL